ncbi:MAG TPA: PASTA domain-containing protein [Elusimicrobiales bacterium]|nr:PASTA domain-containing protein [Elusimicrobiales bacterium]
MEQKTSLAGHAGAQARKLSGKLKAGIGISLAEIFVVAVILFSVSLFVVNWAFKALIHNRVEVTVPDLTRKSAMAALGILSQKNLALRKEGEEFDSTVPVGAVIRQVPPPGTMVREGKIVRAWFSQGGESVFAPNLVGLSLRNAELLLRQSQLLLGEVSESYSLNYEKGAVMAQDPLPDENMNKNAMISVVVSAGQPPSGIVLMPDLTQKSLEDAQLWASEAKVSLDVADDPASLFPNGTVLSQKPKPDTVVSKDSKVEIVVSRRKEAGQAAQTGDFRRIHYEVAQGSTQSQIRITVLDQSGEREVFNGLRAPGSKVDLSVPRGGPAKVRIFVNGMLVEERDLI